MTGINDQDVTQMTFEDPEGEEWARRDANLSWTDSLQPDNRIVSGKFWGPVDGAPVQTEPANRSENNMLATAGESDSTFTDGVETRESAATITPPQISVEQDFAAELGLKLGDEMRFDVAGESVTARVTSMRTVEWDSFSPNFFMVFSPGVLDDFPATYISSMHLEESQRQVVLDLMRTFPSVTAIDLEASLAQVRDVMDKAALAVQAVFVFTLLAGLTVLWAAVQSTRDERRYESAMLRTFGASRRKVLSGVAMEFIAIGLLAGVLAASGATLAGYLVATRLFDLDYQFSLGLWLAGPIFGMALVGLSGMAASWRVVTHSPVSVLRAA